MDYKISVGCSWKTNDMGIADSGTYQRQVPMERVASGYNLFEVLGTDKPTAEVISFENGKLIFSFLDEEESVTAGHTWHSPIFHVDNPYIHEAEGYLVTVKEVQEKTEGEKAVKRIISILKKMRKNAAEEWHPVWKNIPLACEMYDLLHNFLPISGPYMDASEVLFCCDAIFLEDLLSTRDVPRLCLEFLQLRKLALEEQTADDAKFDNDAVLGVQEAERIQNELDFYIDPNVSMEWWVDYVGAHLKFDPVERTLRWEEVIYDVEKECDKRLKKEPRCMGFCFGYWSVKRAVLAKYGIDWHSPSTMNPRVMFD